MEQGTRDARSIAVGTDFSLASNLSLAYAVRIARAEALKLQSVTLVAATAKDSRAYLSVMSARASNRLSPHLHRSKKTGILCTAPCPLIALRHKMARHRTAKCCFQQ
jgi:hypothetical protein